MFSGRRRAVLKVDLHTHTLASGHAMNTAYEMVQAAHNKGLELLALTEHGPKIIGGPSVSYFYIAARFPRRLFGIDVMVGCEANVMDTEGGLDLPERCLALLDIVLAGLHRQAGWAHTSNEANTTAIVEAMKNPYVDVISHPHNPRYDADVERLVAASYEHQVPLEINCHHLRYYERQGFDAEDVRRMIRRVHEHRWQLVVSSDAHMASAIGDDSILDRLGLRELLSDDIILNSAPDAVRRFLTKKRRGRTT